MQEPKSCRGHRMTCEAADLQHGCGWPDETKREQAAGLPSSTAISPLPRGESKAAQHQGMHKVVAAIMGTA